MALPQAPTTENKPKFRELLESYRGELVSAVPPKMAEHLAPDRIIRLAMTEFRRTPKLANCHPQSVCAAIITACQLGLEVGVMGDGWLVPYKDECQFIPGYQGLIKLAHNSGSVLDIEAHVVYEKDEFEVLLGSEKRLHHRPAVDGDRGPMRLVYAMAWLKGAPHPHFDFMTKQQVEAVRNRSTGYRNAVKYEQKDHPWIHPDMVPEMWRKTAIRRLQKQLPKSTAMATALALDDAAERGRQGLGTIRDAIDGSFAPVPENDMPALPELRSIIEKADSPDDIDAALGMTGHLKVGEQKELVELAAARKEALNGQA